MSHSTCYHFYMARIAKPPVHLVVHDTPFKFTARALEGFHEAAAFLGALLDRGGISAPVACEYVRLAARLKRQGRLNDENNQHTVEATAANAYWRWAGQSYATRVQPVIRALSQVDLKRALPYLRRSALIPPFEGKLVPRMVALPQAVLDSETRAAAVAPPSFSLVPCLGWTLHVPTKAVPVHADPCLTCLTIDLSAEQVETIAVAFEQAWGHRQLEKVPSDYLLFGEPPRTYTGEGVVLAKAGRVVALCEPGAAVEALNSIGAKVTADVDSFLARLAEGADSVFISRAAAGDLAVLAHVISAVKNQWFTQTTGQPINFGPLCKCGQPAGVTHVCLATS
jgi:hypothetical protein